MEAGGDSTKMDGLLERGVSLAHTADEVTERVCIGSGVRSQS